MRTPNGAYPQYHTSGDNLDIIDGPSLLSSLAIVRRILGILEADRFYINQNPKCEPQLGKRGIYAAIGGRQREGHDEMALLWVLNLSDSRHSLLDIAERSGIPFAAIARAAGVLLECGLLLPTSEAGSELRST